MAAAEVWRSRGKDHRSFSGASEMSSEMGKYLLASANICKLESRRLSPAAALTGLRVMPFKKHIRPGKIEASPDGDALVVHFTSEITHLDEDGMPINVEKMPDKREVPIGEAMRGLREEDLPALAQEIVEKCRYIPESKTSQVAKIFNLNVLGIKQLVANPCELVLRHVAVISHGRGAPDSWRSVHTLLGLDGEGKHSSHFSRRGKSTICLGMDNIQEVPKRETLAPPGGKSTICLRMDTAAAPVSSNAFACGAHQNSGNVLTERPTTMLSAPPGGKSTLCLGMYTATEHSEPKAKDGETETSSRPPAGKSTFLRSSSTGTETDNLSTRPVGGKDHIVLGAEILELQDSANRVTAGGNSSICFGTDTSEWQVSSKALGQQLEAAPDYDGDESQEKDAPAAVSPAREMDPLEALVSDQPDGEALAPTSSRVPPGGLASVVLGTAASEWKIREDLYCVGLHAPSRESPQDPTDAKLEVKQLKQDQLYSSCHLAALSSSRNTATCQDLPTPARSIRAPPGGAATVLKKLYGLQSDALPFSKDFGAGATQSSTNRTSGGDSVLPAQLEDLLPSASVRNLDEYVEELYEEHMDMKVRGAQRLLRLCTEVRILDQMTEHPTLLGVLSRELRENAKRSYELAVAITGIFLILANFSCFHVALKRHQCGEVTMRVLEYESKRRNVMKNELVQTQEQMASSQLPDERTRLQRTLGKCRARLERQDHLLQICLLVLRAMSEDTAQELKFVKQKLCQMLVPMLGRQHEDLLLSTLSMLHKLTIFEQNKDQLLKEEVFQRLAELFGHPATEVAFLAMRVCFNLSFDSKGRAFLASQSNVVARLMAAAVTSHSTKPPFKVVSLRLLYHLTLDPAARSTLTSRHPTIASMALQLVAQSKEKEPEALALLLNLAADEAAACLLLAEEAFVTVALRGIKGSQVILKVLRHIASHQASRSILLDVMGGGPDAPGSSHAWLLELVRLAQSTAADRHDVLVEALGILAALDCSSPEVPWPELCEAGLLELLPRLLMVGFSEDDVVLEAVMLLSVLALDPPSAALLANSKVIHLLPDVMAAKTKDADLMVQSTFLLRCLIMSDATRDAILQTDAPARVLELPLLRSPEPAVQDAAHELLEIIAAAEAQAGRASRWTKHLQEYKYKVHNSEWLDAEGEAKPRRTKELSPEQRSPSRDPSKRSPLTATAATATGGQSGYRSPGPEVCCTLASSREKKACEVMEPGGRRSFASASAHEGLQKRSGEFFGRSTVPLTEMPKARKPATSWKSGAVPRTIRRPWRVFDEEMENRLLQAESTSGKLLCQPQKVET
eukprot:s3190_g8.t2